MPQFNFHSIASCHCYWWWGAATTLSVTSDQIKVREAVEQLHRSLAQLRFFSSYHLCKLVLTLPFRLAIDDYIIATPFKTQAGLVGAMELASTAYHEANNK